MGAEIKGKWITNIKKDWIPGYLPRKIIGKPQATDFYTVVDLEEMGMVGIYEAETEVESDE